MSGLEAGAPDGAMGLVAAADAMGVGVGKAGSALPGGP